MVAMSAVSRWLCVVGLMFMTNAMADVRSESYSVWRFESTAAETQITARLTISHREAGRILPSLAVQGVSLSQAFVTEFDRFVLADDQFCEVIRTEAALRVQVNQLQILKRWRCAQSMTELSTANAQWSISRGQYLAHLDRHLHILQVYDNDNLVLEKLLTEPAQTVSFSLDEVSTTVQTTVQVLQQYFMIGVMHIIHGLDHLLFLLTLLIIASTGRRVLLLITGFTLGHALTIGLMVLTTITPNAAKIESLIAYSIIFVALLGLINPRVVTRMTWNAMLAVLLLLTGLLVTTGIVADNWTFLTMLFCWSLGLIMLYQQVAQSTGFHLMLTIGFGLIHGLGFGGSLRTIGVPLDAIWPALIAFNLGVELAQIIAVGILIGLSYSLTLITEKYQHHQLISPATFNGMRFLHQPPMTTSLIGLCCLISSYWFITRLAGA